MSIQSKLLTKCKQKVFPNSMGNLSINFQSKPTNYVGKRHGDMISDRQKDETTCKGKMTIIKPQPAPNHPASTSLSMPGN